MTLARRSVRASLRWQYLVLIGDKDVRMLMLYNPGGYEYYWRRAMQYTPEQRKQPDIQKMLRAESDFHIAPQ